MRRKRTTEQVAAAIDFWWDQMLETDLVYYTRVRDRDREELRKAKRAYLIAKRNLARSTYILKHFRR